MYDTFGVDYLKDLGSTRPRHMIVEILPCKKLFPLSLSTNIIPAPVKEIHRMSDSYPDVIDSIFIISQVADDKGCRLTD